MPTTANPPKLRRKIDLGTPVEDGEDNQPKLTLGAPANPPITDAQAADLQPGDEAAPSLSLSSGYTAQPIAPSGVMGGDQTKPDDMTQKIQAATAVESKGGPPVSELSASADKGPVKQGLTKQGLIAQPLRKPQEAETTPTPAPETKPEPIAPRAIAPGAETPVKKAEPVVTPTPAPTPAPTTDQTQQTQDQTQQTVPPSLQDPAFRANIEKYGGAKVLGQDQDYSGLDTSVTQDPNFAGKAQNGRPLYFDRNQNRFYIKDDTAPGTEVRHYQGAKYGSDEWKGVTVVDENKAQITRDAQTRLAALIQAQKAIGDFQTQSQDFTKNSNQDINPIQRLALAEQMKASGGKWDWLLKAGIGAAQNLGITNEVYNLETARNNVANLAGQAASKNLPESQKTLELPDVTDPLPIQQRKVAALQQRLQDEAATYYRMYPFANKWLKDAEIEAMGPENAKKYNLKSTGAAQNVSAQPNAQPNASPSPSPPRQPTYEEAQAAPKITSTDDLKKYKSGTLVRDLDGKLKYVP